MENNILEVFHDAFFNSIDFLYEEFRLKYFDLFFMTAKNILEGEILQDLDDEKKEKLKKIYEPISDVDIDVETIRKALQALILKGFKEQNISNGSITPDTIGMLFAYLISKFEPKKRDVKILDILSGVGNLDFTLLNYLDLNIDMYAVEHNELYVKIMKTCADLMDQNLNIYFQDTLNTSFSGMDYVVADFDYDQTKDGKYFPFSCINHHIDSLKDEGIMIAVIPNDFFSHDEDQSFKKEITQKASIIGLIELPDEMFKNNAKSIILIKKQVLKDKKCLMVKLPTFSDSKKFNDSLVQIETWFENNINKK